MTVVSTAFDDERFRKEERLRKRPQFLRTRRQGRRGGGRWVVAYALPNDEGHPRLGVTASRRVGNAVRRNEWKRRLRDIFRRNKRRFGASHDVVIIVKGGQALPEYEDLRRDVFRAVGRAHAELERRGAKR